MYGLGVRKFFVDYFIASVLLVLSLYLFVGGIKVVDMQVTVGLVQSCSSGPPDQDVLQQLQEVLYENEQCEMLSPCDEWKIVRCEAELGASDLFVLYYKSDLLLNRVSSFLEESYGVWSQKDTSVLNFSPNLVMFFVAYAVILVEAGAMLIALWRQKQLKKTFSLPRGSKRHQLLTPLAIAVLFAICAMGLNVLIQSYIELPERFSDRLTTTLVNSVYGILAIVVLAPFVEEVIFRGVLLRFFVERNQLVLGSVLVSLLFSLLHGFVVSELLWQSYLSSVYFTASLVMCWLYIKQRNLWSPIIFHSGYNGMLVLAIKIIN